MSIRTALRPSQYVCKACRISLTASLKRRKYGTNSITSNPKPEDIYDVVTVGGGPVGLALLAALKSSPTTSHLKCKLIESQPLPDQLSWSLPSDQYSNRAVSITPTNQDFLEQIGAWRHLDLTRVQPYDEMQVWDAGNEASIQFDWRAEAATFNAPVRTVATMVENSNLVRALLRRLEELGVKDGDGDALMGGWKVKGIGNGIDEPGSLNLDTWPVIQLESTEGTKQIAARLLVGADGINSPVRTFAGINTNGWDYNRHGVVATLKLEPTNNSPFSTASSTANDQDLDEALEDFLSDSNTSSSDRSTSNSNNNITPSNRATAYQRFLPSLGGPIAILPLPNNHASLVWSTTHAIARTLKTLSPAALVATLNAALRLDEVDINYMLSLPSPQSAIDSSNTTPTQHEEELTWRLQHTPAPTTHPPRIIGVQAGTVASFPLRLRNATSYTAPRIALAGDAAHTVHPLAGQGLNLGLGDVEALSRVIAAATEGGRDLGDLMSLEHYASERFGKALVMGSGVDALNWVYQLGGGVDSGILGRVLGGVRGLGMWAVNSVPGIKEQIMRRAD